LIFKIRSHNLDMALYNNKTIPKQQGYPTSLTKKLFL